MKQITLEVQKKNRVYFKCLQGTTEVKLRITPESENLTLGTHDLLVNDESVRTKYGTDIIYSLRSVVDLEDGICTFQHCIFNEIALKRCRDLGGKWDSETKVWTFSTLVEDQVDKLELLFNCDIVGVEITATQEMIGYKNPVYFCGYSVATAFNRDSGAKVGDGVSLISGEITSGGSVKNWQTVVRKGCTFRLKISRNLLEEIDRSGWDCVVI